jgi:hypothetical protein
MDLHARVPTVTQAQHATPSLTSARMSRATTGASVWVWWEASTATASTALKARTVSRIVCRDSMVKAVLAYAAATTTSVMQSMALAIVHQVYTILTVQRLL